MAVTSGDAFQDLMARLRTGDEAAATEVFQRFVYRLIALTRNQFDSWLRFRVDPEDIVQSVYRSFFTRFRAGQFDISNWESLWGLLALITLRKCANRVEYLRAGRRAIGNEEKQARTTQPEPLLKAMDDAPSPLEAAILTETLERLLNSLPERERTIVQLHLEGHEIPAISLHVGRSQRTVRRVLELARRQLVEALTQEPLA
jgi:RNA polymerase sigma-70 factor (ECF subfamily)